MNDKTKKTILLVEDEILIAMSQKMFLEKYGYKVLSTNTGEKAIEILKKDAEIEIALLPESKKVPLEKFGYHVITANSAEQAVKIFDENANIDLVLMDINLGNGMDGTQAAEIILKQRDIPILFFSSHTEPEVVEKTEKITSYGYVVKDSSITVLDASIKMAFKLFDANKIIMNELIERKKMDEMLRISETRYRRLFETTKEGILILDAETGMIVDVNPFLIDLLGYSHEMFMDKTVWDIGFLKDIIGNKDKFMELQKNNYARYENMPLETADGKIIEVEFISNVYEVVKVKVIQCNIRVITERREIETGLENTRKELAIIKKTADIASEFAESVINTVREPLLSLDQDLRVVTVSRSFYDVFKVKPEETVGHLIYDLGNKQWDIPKLRELLENILPKQVSFDNYEVEHDFATIGKRIMLLNARQIQQASGKQRTILLAIEDITARKEIEAGLENTRKELAIIKKTADIASEFAESVINTVREPLLSLDQDLRVVAVSRSFYDVFKVKPEETVGQLIYDLGNKQWDIPKLRELLENILPKQVSFDNYEVEHDFATIGKRIMLLNARQIQQASGKQRTILLAIEDITERKEAEKKIEALLVEKDIILKEVHHRIKNSMNTIKSLLHLQTDSLKDPIAIEALKDTQSRVQSMMVLYDKLYRSVDFNAMSIKEYLFSLIDEIVDNFPNSNSVTIQKNIGDFLVDAKKLQSVGIIINELLTNIMKYAFTNREKGLISVAACLKGTSVLISIQDDGRGIPEEITFENSEGFGLTLVRILTDQLGGTIRIVRGNGTNVILEFNI